MEVMICRKLYAVILSSYQLVCVSIRANTKPKARRYARPKGGSFLPMFFDSVLKSPYPFTFSLPVLCQEQYFIYKNI